MYCGLLLYGRHAMQCALLCLARPRKLECEEWNLRGNVSTVGHDALHTPLGHACTSKEVCNRHISPRHERRKQEQASRSDGNRFLSIGSIGSFGSRSATETPIPILFRFRRASCKKSKEKKCGTQQGVATAVSITLLLNNGAVCAGLWLNVRFRSSAAHTRSRSALKST
jgi:hypothetical protein